MNMKVTRWVGVVLLILGIAALLFPVPHYEDHSVKAGDVKIEVQSRRDEKLPPVIGVVAILSGAVLLIARGRER